MASGAVHAFGTFLKIGDGAGPEVFTTIAEVRSIRGPTIQGTVVDVTNHSSGIPWREKKASLIDPGQVVFDIAYVPTEATHNQTSGLLRDLKNRTLRNFKLVFPDGGASTWTFAAFVTQFSAQEPIDNVILATVTLELSGQPGLV